MAEQGILYRKIVSDRTKGKFEGELMDKEALLTDYLFEKALPLFHETGVLEGIVSVLELDNTFATFVSLPKEWRKKAAPKFNKKNEAMFSYYFSELNVNYTWKNENGIFRAKVVMHCRRQGDVNVASSIFDKEAYKMGDYK